MNASELIENMEEMFSRYFYSCKWVITNNDIEFVTKSLISKRLSHILKIVLELIEFM